MDVEDPLQFAADTALLDTEVTEDNFRQQAGALMRDIRRTSLGLPDALSQSPPNSTPLGATPKRKAMPAVVQDTQQAAPECTSKTSQQNMQQQAGQSETKLAEPAEETPLAETPLAETPLAEAAAEADKKPVMEPAKELPEPVKVNKASKKPASGPKKGKDGKAKGNKQSKESMGSNGDKDGEDEEKVEEEPDYQDWTVLKKKLHSATWQIISCMATFTVFFLLYISGVFHLLVLGQGPMAQRQQSMGAPCVWGQETVPWLIGQFMFYVMCNFSSAFISFLSEVDLGKPSWGPWQGSKFDLVEWATAPLQSCLHPSVSGCQGRHLGFEPEKKVCAGRGNIRSKEFKRDFMIPFKTQLKFGKEPHAVGAP